MHTNSIKYSSTKSRNVVHRCVKKHVRTQSRDTLQVHLRSCGYSISSWLFMHGHIMYCMCVCVHAACSYINAIKCRYYIFLTAMVPCQTRGTWVKPRACDSDTQNWRLLASSNNLWFCSSIFSNIPLSIFSQAYLLVYNSHCCLGPPTLLCFSNIVVNRWITFITFHN